jgi:hypothetical protein
MYIIVMVILYIFTRGFFQKIVQAYAEYMRVRGERGEEVCIGECFYE